MKHVIFHPTFHQTRRKNIGRNVGLVCSGLYMDTDSFKMRVKTEDFYKDIANDVEEKYDTSKYTCEIPLPIGKN